MQKTREVSKTTHRSETQESETTEIESAEETNNNTVSRLDCVPFPHTSSEQYLAAQSKVPPLDSLTQPIEHKVSML